MSKIYQNSNLQILLAVTLISIMGVSSIIPVLGLISHKFNISPATIGMIFTVFSLPGIIFAPLSGILADRAGRKKILIPSLILFALAGTACFFASDYNTLLLLRFIQGVGASAIGVLSLTIIGDIFSGRERIKAMGLNAGVLSMGTAIFPAIGGALAQISWRAPFLLSLLALPVAYIVAFKLNSPEPDSHNEFKNYLKLALAGMNNKAVLGLFSITLMTFIILYGPIITYLPMLIHDKFNGSPLVIGLIIACPSLLTAVAASQIGKLSKRISQPTMIGLSTLGYASCMIMLPHAPSALWCIVPVCFFGIGQGLNMPNSMSMLTAIAPMEHRAAFMSVNAMILRISQTIAPLMMGLVYSSLGIDFTFYAGATIAMLMLLTVITCLFNKNI